RAPPVFRSPVTGHGHDSHVLQPGQLAHLLCNLVAVHFGQSDIEQHHIRPKRCGMSQRIGGRIDRHGHMSLEFQNEGHRFGGILIVIDHEHALRDDIRLTHARMLMGGSPFEPANRAGPTSVIGRNLKIDLLIRTDYANDPTTASRVGSGAMCRKPWCAESLRNDDRPKPVCLAYAAAAAIWAMSAPD